MMREGVYELPAAIRQILNRDDVCLNVIKIITCLDGEMCSWDFRRAKSPFLRRALDNSGDALIPRLKVTSRWRREPYRVSTADSKNKPGRSCLTSDGLCTRWVLLPAAKTRQTDWVCFSTPDSKGLHHEGLSCRGTDASLRTSRG